MPDKPKALDDLPKVRIDESNPSEKDLPPADPETTEAARAAFEAAQAPARKAGDKCPKTGAKLVPYDGDNPHKAGSVVCERCGQRFLPDAVLCPEA